MGSDKRNGREDRSKKGPSDPRRRRMGLPFAEPLEERRMLTGYVATSTDIYDPQHGPMADLGATLINVYRDYANYVNSGSTKPYTPALSNLIYFSGTSVGVTVRGSNNFTALEQALTQFGVKITATSSLFQTVDGFVPIASLPKLAILAQVNGVDPQYKPILHNYQGVANNEGVATLNVPASIQSTNTAGAGQKIGAISDSVNEYPNPAASAAPPGTISSSFGLGQSYSTGDLAPNSVQVLADLPADPTTNQLTGTDEGRAMLEEIHDIAPGAQLGFSSIGETQTTFASSITNLYNAGYKTIVDDVGFPNEPDFQDGPIAVAVNTVTAQGATYLAAAGNASDDGYLSQFRGVNATVGTLGAGRYQNFDGTGQTQTTQLGVYVPNNAVTQNSPPELWFQFDQPVNNVTSDLTAYLLDSSGNIAYQSVSSTQANNTPIQVFVNPAGTSASIAPGTYTLVVKVNSGADPGHITLYNPTDSELAFDQKFGSAGQTFYPTTLGHAAAANTIGVGAVPFWGARPFLNTSTPHNESYSSFGPVVSVFNPDGTPKATPQVVLKPDLSAPDYVNTSFFIPGQVPNDTTQPTVPANPEYPGDAPTTTANPVTTVNDAQPNLPTFSGSSAAAPNLAAVVAIIKQTDPTVTNSQLLAALDSTATPLNGSAQGVWNAQGGYGLANAAAALAAVSAVAPVQVSSISPGSGQTITSIPYNITVTFNKPINIQTLSASSLQVAGANGATVTVGQPVGVDSATFPTTVQFPILINAVPGRIANGVYTTRVAGGTIKGQDGTTLQNTFTDTFNLQQTVAPTVARTNFLGRVVSLSFSGPVNPASVTPNNVFLFRAGGVNNPLFNPGDIYVSQLPGAVFSYNPSTWTVTVDLTNVAQSQLPTDQYALVAKSAITDQVGNPLNGAFNGVFPSGIFPSAGSGTNFVQNLGVVNLPAPVISSLALSPNSDSGVQGDSDTNISSPSFIGQVTAQFPNTNAGLQVYAQFNGISHPGVAAGGLNLGIGANGRGVVGEYDVVTTTDANGRFVINYPAGITPLPEGQNIIRAVVVGATDAPPAGLSASIDTTFQIDRTLPYVGTLNGTSPTSIVENASINNLSTLSISVVDPVNPASLSSPFAVNAQTRVLALNPATSNATGSYILDLITPTGQVVDESSFLRGATFVSTSARVLTTDPFTGRIDLAFGTGLPQGRYVLTVKGAAPGSSGVTDQAGNPITNSAANSASGRANNFTLDFNLQPTPTYITNYGAYGDNGQGNIYGVISAPRASYEIPAAGTTPGAPAPPTAFTLDFSNRLDPTVNYTNLVEVVRSADSATARPDGDFGNFGTPAGLTNPTGFTRVPGISVQLVNSISNATLGQPGYQDRLFITLPAGSTLPADYYRVYLPNVGTQAIRDVFGNQLDGEFLGYQNAAGKYVNQLNTGQVRGSGTFEAPDLSGDGTPGGAFVTGFVVVPNGNVIYARPDAIYNPQLPGTFPDGTQAKPYPVLAPEATSTSVNNGDLNSVVNSGINFNPVYDRSGLGTFQPSAFFAAQEKARITQAPVVIVAEPALLTRDPLTGIVTQRPFVLQAPAPTQGQFDPIANDGSAAVPAMTTLLFAQGSTLKLQNSALLVQNQGSALQIEGGPNPTQFVNFTSYKDSSIGGATNGDPSTLPVSGDYGGILFRNYDQAAPGGRSSLFPGQIPITGSQSSDGRLKGPFTDPGNRNSQLDAVSGADDVMSFVNFLVEKYAGGQIPQTTGTAYDGITLQDSRPTVVNSTIAFAGSGSSQAGLSEDVDSLRLDDVASGPLVRNDNFVSNGINGIYIRGRVSTGIAQASNSTNVGTVANTVGGGRTFILNAPYPYVLTTSLVIGLDLLVETQGQTIGTPDRLYVSPGSIVKFAPGAGAEVLPSASINVGDQTYIRGFDANANYAPGTAGFRANSANLSNVIFTSYFDDAATTTYTDPQTGIVSTVTPALPTPAAGSGANLISPAVQPASSYWSGLTIDTGARAVINSAVFRYGGGSLNTLQGTDNGQNSSDWHHALELSGGGIDSAEHFNGATNGFFGGFFSGLGPGLGSRTMVTNSTFTNNLDVGLNVDPDAILAADPLRPLASGNPFIHGNIFVNNGLDGVGIAAGTGIPVGGSHLPNLDVNSTWTGGDFTYILRDTIVLGPDGGFFRNVNGGVSLGAGVPPTPSGTQFQTTPTPNVTLTLQSTLPGTVLADGTTVPAPGVPLIIKTLNNANARISAAAIGVNPGANTNASWAGGAGFIVGVDDGTDPPTPGELLVDDGAFSQIRILGIPGNSSTGQVRVPVTITSVHDNSVGTAVNGTVMDQVIPGDTTPARAGDGGLIYFGGNSLTTYNLQDPRSGSLIDNADIKYMTRIQQQGGGIVYTVALNGATSYSATTGDVYGDKFGNSSGFGTGQGGPNYLAQYNLPKQLAITDSNLSTFSDGGVVSVPGYGILAVNTNYPAPATLTRIGGILGEPTHLYLVNDTISDMNVGSATNNAAGNPGGLPTTTTRGTGVDLISQLGNDNPGSLTSPAMAVILNSVFYNTDIGINSTGEAFNGLNPYSHVSFLAMNNIFQGDKLEAVQAVGQQDESNLQYNLFYQNGAELVTNGTTQFFNGNFNNRPYENLDPGFRDPAAGNFNLTANSAALDRSRSELGPSVFGNFLAPSATYARQTTINGQVATDVNFLPIRNNTGNSNDFGGDGFANPGDEVTLPGLPLGQPFSRGYPDQWVPTTLVAPLGTPINVNALSSTSPGTVGNGYSLANYAYTPIFGQRDQAGNLRGGRTSGNTGFGSNPTIDLGAFEFLIQNPPLVTGVTATAANSSTISNLYVPNGLAGINQYPSQITVGINERLNPATITPASVQLIGSGGDGVFGNANDINYNLANRLSFDITSNHLIINTAGLFTPAQLNDEFELVLKGTGSAILRDNNGLALDGYTNNDTVPLPSGSDKFPGSDFSVLFTISTHSPSLVAGTFGLAPGSFNTAINTAGAANVGAPVTNNNRPTFVGQITDIFPPANPLQGDQVFVDISTTGDPNNFNDLGAATGVTNATGNFSVTVAQPLPNSTLNVGPDGIQGTRDDLGITLARVRVVNAAGNQSILPTAPFSTFLNAGAAYGFQVDTVPPRVTALTPASSTLATPNADGTVTISATFSKNIDPTTLTGNSIIVTRAGGTGNFTGAGIPVPIVSGSVRLNYLHTPTGAETVTFALQGPLPNDFYRITLKGTGAAPIRDIAGNALDGAGTGVPGSGDFTNQPFTVFSPGNARLLYVDNTSTLVSTTGLGTRENPYHTIAAGLAAAQTGDDVLVLPGTYRELVNLKGQVRLLSADPTSTDAGFFPGNPLATIIYGNTTASTFNTTQGEAVVGATNLTNIPGVPTEISGFTILAPLFGDSVRGSLDPTSAGVNLFNSNVLVDKNYIVNAGLGVNIITTGGNVIAPIVRDNVIVGNVVGVSVNDQGTTTSYAQPTEIINNTIADNTYGVVNVTSRTGTLQAYVLNDIFYSNHDLTTSRTGTGILSQAANTVAVGSNLFFGNGVSGAPSSNAIGTFANFNPAFLSSRPDAVGNLLGDPAFVSARDPRPNGDTPPVFFLYANYDLTSRSPAINAALQSVAPPTDILYRTPVPIAGKGFNGSGPASIGAFYYLGTGGIFGTTGNGGGKGPIPISPVALAIRVPSTDGPSLAGGSLPIGTRQFAVVNTSLNPDGTATGAAGIATPLSGLTSIDVNFSDNIDASSVKASDLILTGSGLNPANPAKATGLTWVDSHTIRFMLTGGFNSTGSVNLSIPQGTVKDTVGDSIAPFAETFLVESNSLVPLPSAQPAAVATPATVALPIQPVAVAGPIAVNYSHHLASSKSHHAAKPAAHHKASTAKTHPAVHKAAKTPAKHRKAAK